MTNGRVVPEARGLWLNGIAVILMASVLFGVMAVCVRIAARDMATPQIALVRFGGSLAVLLAMARGRRLRPRAGNLNRVMLRGVLGASAILFYYHGIDRAGAGLATLVQCTYPVFTALFAATLMGERFDWRIAVALGLNVIGATIVLSPTAAVGTAGLAGGMSALAAAVFAGGAVATARDLRTNESAFLITTYFMGIGTLMMTPAVLLGAPTMTHSLLLALSAVVLSSVVAQVLLHHGLGFAPATQGSLAAATSVVTAAVLEAVFLGEHLSQQSLMGAGFMLGAIALAASRTAGRDRTADPGPAETPENMGSAAGIR